MQDNNEFDAVSGDDATSFEGAGSPAGNGPEKGSAGSGAGQAGPASPRSPESPASPTDPVFTAKLAELEELASERTADLQRLHAEYANYKKRVDRDRGLARAAGVEAVVLDLLPVLDSIEAAREHSELTGGFKLVADELEKISAKYGLVAYGEVGEAFDPAIHEALMHVPFEGEHDTIVVSAVMQKGIRLNDRVIRPARVGVADPD